jgi:hypothetical protein
MNMMSSVLQLRIHVIGQAVNTVNLLVTVPAGISIVSQAGIQLAQMKISTYQNKPALLPRISAMQQKEFFLN